MGKMYSSKSCKAKKKFANSLSGNRRDQRRTIEKLERALLKIQSLEKEHEKLKIEMGNFGKELKDIKDNFIQELSTLKRGMTENRES